MDDQNDLFTTQLNYLYQNCESLINIISANKTEVSYFHSINNSEYLRNLN
jgi:hypothetical protein